MGVPRFLVEPWGGHFAPLGKLVYVLLDYVFPLDSRLAFGLMLAMHLLCTGLVGVLIRDLTNRPLLAACLAVVFGAAPVHSATLGWVANFAQLFLTAQVLLALRVGTRLCREGGPVRTRDAWICAALVAAGSVTFGIGYATSIAVPLVITILNPRLLRVPAVLLPFALAALSGPTVYLLFGRDSATGASLRSLALLGLLFADGVAILWGRFGGTLGARTTLATPFGDLPLRDLTSWSPWLLAAFVAAVGWAFFRGNPNARRRIVAFAIFPLAIYGVIALGRAGLSRDLEALALQSRYHYSSLTGVVILIGVVVDAFATRKSSSVRAMAAAAIVCSLVVLGSSTAARVTDTLGSAARRSTIRAVEGGLRGAVYGAGTPGGTLFIRNQEFSPVAPLRMIGIGMGDFPGIAGFFLLAHPDGHLNGTKVRFVERDVSVVEALRQGQPAVRELMVSEVEALRMGVAVKDIDLRSE
jgi:hypothetical protein